MSVFAATGPKVIDLAGEHHRKVRFSIRSSGVVVYGVRADGDLELLYAGSGAAKVRAAGPFKALSIEPSGKLPWQIEVPELRDTSATWTDDVSFTDMEPKPVGQLSPEVRAIMDQMNRNAIAREQAMLRALGRRPQ